MSVQDIPALVDRVRALAESAESRRKAALWAPEAADAKDHWRGTPRPFAETGAAPFTVESEFPLRSSSCPTRSS